MTSPATDGSSPISIPSSSAHSRERLIVALDFSQAQAALDLVDLLDGMCQWFKVGLELYLAEGNRLVAELLRRDLSVFLDLKLHDIPNTVAAAVQSISRLGVGMLTVHAAGGSRMLSAAAEAAAQSAAQSKDMHSPTLLAVTVLTSMDAPELKATGVSSEPTAQVERLAEMAFASGISGLVASAEEIQPLRRRFGQQALLVIPGIRPSGESAGDQKRVATPSQAISAGANYLVVGRPITRAADPGAAAKAILDEMAGASPQTQISAKQE